MLSIFASLAEYNRENISGKTRVGQQLAAAQGKHMGRPKGLDVDKLAKENDGQRLIRSGNSELDGNQPCQCQAHRKHLHAGLAMQKVS
jgi:DNA invertase Pin-like site-specific DNA recombinase